MNYSKVIFFAVLLGAAALPIVSKAEEPSTFQVFKTVCIDTQLDKTTISEKAMTLGASQVEPPSKQYKSVLTDIPQIRDNAVWVAKRDVRQLTIMYSSIDFAFPPKLAKRTEYCRVIVQIDDARVMDEFVQWTGISTGEATNVPSIAGMPQITGKSFEFEIIDGKHVPLPSSWRNDAAYSNKVTWKAEVTKGRVLALSLERTRPI